MGEYPRHVHMRGGVYLEVWTDAEKAQAEADGWLIAPPPGPAPDEYQRWEPGMPTPTEPPLPKKPRGRPRKTKD